jgi:hypothetical protein
VPTFKNLTGRSFGRLTVVRQAFSSGRTRWTCRCTCGTCKDILSTSLLNGSSQSCGCFRRELVTATNRSHGQTGSLTYVSWSSMWTRCTNKNRQVWKYYGGRGIEVCKRWKSFEAFLEDMGTRPSGLTLERRDTDGHYSKKNCYWATRKQQALSRRNSRWVVYNGRRQTISAWAAELGWSWSAMRNRLERLPKNRALQPKT